MRERTRARIGELRIDTCAWQCRVCHVRNEDQASLSIIEPASLRQRRIMASHDWHLPPTSMESHVTRVRMREGSETIVKIVHEPTDCSLTTLDYCSQY